MLNIHSSTRSNCILPVHSPFYWRRPRITVLKSVSGVKQMGSKVSPNIRIFSLSQFMKYLSPNVNSESRHIVQLLKQLACNDHPVWLSKVNGQPYCVWKTRGDNFRQTSSLFQLKLILDNPARALLVGI